MTSAGEQILKEARLGLRLDHRNLVQLFGVLEIPQTGLVLVLELAGGGSLRSILSDTATHAEIDWSVRVRWLLGIAQGLQRLHGLRPRAVIHRDLKAANVLLSSADLRTAIPKVRTADTTFRSILLAGLALWLRVWLRVWLSGSGCFGLTSIPFAVPTGCGFRHRGDDGDHGHSHVRSRSRSPCRRWRGCGHVGLEGTRDLLRP